MFDRRHVGRTVFGSQAHEVVVEDDVENPVEAVFDAPMGSLRGRIERRTRGPRTDNSVSRGASDFAGSGVNVVDLWESFLLRGDVPSIVEKGGAALLALSR